MRRFRFYASVPVATLVLCAYLYEHHHPLPYEASDTSYRHRVPLHDDPQHEDVDPVRSTSAAVGDTLSRTNLSAGLYGDELYFLR
jgi:hypothetical protein